MTYYAEATHIRYIHRQVTTRKAKSGVVKHQKKLVVLKTTSNVNGHFKSGFAPLYRSLVTSLILHVHVHILRSLKIAKVSLLTKVNSRCIKSTYVIENGTCNCDCTLLACASCHATMLHTYTCTYDTADLRRNVCQLHDTY